MKKILSILIILISCMCFGFTHAATTTDCDFDVEGGENIGYALEDCFKDANVVNTEIRDASGQSVGVNNLKVEGGFKYTIESWIQSLGSILAILAVGSIVYGAFMMVISAGEEEKLKKGKDVVKWGILGFLGVVFAGALITIVVNIMFSI